MSVLLMLCLQAQAGTSTTAEADTLRFPALPLDESLGLDLLREELTKSSTTGNYTLEDSVIRGSADRSAPTARFSVELGKLSVIPRRSAADHLMLAPGLLVTNTGGEGHAHQTAFRGFAGGIGENIEYLVDGAPINEISNAHNHGYADVTLLPPEVVQGVEVTAGVFDPVQGDFAFAGTAKYLLGVPDRGSRVSVGYGLRDTFRTLALIAPHDQDDGTFAAFELYRTEGFGENRAAQRANGIARYAQDDGGTGLRWNVTLIGQGSRWDQAGVIREDDFEAGRIGFFDTYDPVQSGEVTRLMFTMNGAVGPSNSEYRQSFFGGFRGLRIRENFTGFSQDMMTPQRGDGAEQRYDARTAGGRGEYRRRFELWGQPQQLSLGYAVRYDEGASTQLRIRTVTGIPYTTIFDRTFRVLNLSGFGGAELSPLEWLTVSGGVRVETFSFGVTDLNQPEADREGDRVPNQTSQSFGFALNPRVTTQARFGDWTASLSYGQGTRSTEAAALSDNETAPFARSQQFEAGLRFAIESEKMEFASQAAYVLALVSDDLVFEPSAGRNVLVGGTTRHAVLLASRFRYGGWFDALVNTGFTYATLDETGELLPYVPQFILRSDVAAAGPLWDWRFGGRDVEGRIGVGFTGTAGRPLPFDEIGDPFFLLSAAAQVRFANLSLGIEGRNLLNLRYRQTEFNYVSNFAGPTAQTSRLPERHFAVGEPLMLMGTITVHLEDWLKTAER